MSHLAVRNLIRDAVLSVRDRVNFVYARESDANSIKGKEFPFVNLTPLNSTGSFTNNSYNLTKTFRVAIVFYRLDSLQGAEEETAKILDDMDSFSDKFLTKLNLRDFITSDSINDGITSDDITIANIRKNQVIKVTTDMLTGWIVEFDMTVPDQLDYCSIYDS